MDLILSLLLPDDAKKGENEAATKCSSTPDVIKPTPDGDNEDQAGLKPKGKSVVTPIPVAAITGGFKAAGSGSSAG
ncbi:hypothetical protein Q0M83_14625, partial [Staphylococcus aureus]|nr:hypothetical protein [Staphylococcus aureus]